MSSSSEDESAVVAPVDPDVPEFNVIPRRLWEGRTVSLHNGSGVRIAEGLLRNPKSSAILGSSRPLGDTQVVVQVSTTLFMRKLRMNGGIHLNLGLYNKYF